MDSDYSVIVPGGLNTDIIGLGVDRILGSGELTVSGELRIGPGGKARNMAQMAAAFLGKGRVAMIGRTARDPFGLWKVPIAALQRAGVDTSYVKVLDFDAAEDKYPGIALIPVDRAGSNQIYVLPGVNADFGREDIDAAQELFSGPGDKRILLLALEVPLAAVDYCLDKAAAAGIRVVLDPGGVPAPLPDHMVEKVFLVKPNEHEIKILTGCPVHDFISAGAGAEVLLSKGAKYVLVTHGASGAYFFSAQESLHIPCPDSRDTGIRDETGCGDQVSAIIAAGLAEGMDLIDAVKWAVAAGTLQFQRAGIQPISRKDLESFIQEVKHEA